MELAGNPSREVRASVGQDSDQADYLWMPQMCMSASVRLEFEISGPGGGRDPLVWDIDLVCAAS